MSTAVNEMEVTAETRMAEVLRVFPGAQRALFRKYHIGGCSSCGFDPNETLGQVCARNNNLNVAEVLEHIETSHAADEQIYVTPQELARWRAENVPMRLVDIRTREEFDATRIEGAILFTQEIMTEMLGRWPRNELARYLRSSRHQKHGRSGVLPRPWFHQCSGVERRHRCLERSRSARCANIDFE